MVTKVIDERGSYTLPPAPGLSLTEIEWNNLLQLKNTIRLYSLRKLRLQANTERPL